MITLNAGEAMYGTSSDSNIVYTLYNNAEILMQGFFQMPQKVMYQAATKKTITGIFLHNNNNIDTQVIVQAVGNNSNNIIYKAHMLAGYSATYAGGHWTMYDEDGVPVIRDIGTNITVSDTAPSNPSMGDLWVDLAP